MKKFVIILLIILSNLVLFSQNQETKYKIDQTDPNNVVNTIFYAARTGDYLLLENLCDSLGEGDGDTKRICMLSNLKKQADEYGETEEIKETFEKFRNCFKSASSFGKVQYEISGSGNEIAKVSFIFNHQEGESRSSEVMKLIKRDGKWYLYSF
jgi:hypothetical protein